jgi:hypothetical protein
MGGRESSAELALAEVWPFSLNLCLNPFDSFRLRPFPAGFHLFSTLEGSLFVLFAPLDDLV